MLSTQNTNINYYPIIDEKYASTPGTQITLGDIHANALKFVNILVRHNVLKITPEEYEEIAAIYRNDVNSLAKDHIDRFNEILDKAEINPCGIIRLMGDELSDRGMNDYFILKIIKKLNKSGVDLRIIASNHAMSFIQSYETLYIPPYKFKPYGITADSCRSIINLQKIIDRGIIKREEVVKLINNYYKPCLKAVDISVHVADDENDDDIVSYYQHAPFGRNSIKDLAEQFNVRYDFSNTNEKINTINRINDVYTEKVNENKVKTLLPSDKDMAKEKYNAWYLALWNREAIDPSDLFSNENYISGHDGCGIRTEITDKYNIFDLDNDLGKGPIYSNEGSYSFLFSLDYLADLKKQWDKAHEIAMLQENMDEDIFKLITSDEVNQYIFSKVQLERLHYLFCDADSKKIWADLFENNASIKFAFSEAVTTNCAILDVLAILKKKNLLTKDNLQSVFNQPESMGYLYNILLILEQTNENLLNQQVFDLCMSKNLFFVSEAMRECKYNGGLKTEPIENIIKNCTDENFVMKLRLFNFFSVHKPKYINTSFTNFINNNNDTIQYATIYYLIKYLSKFYNQKALNYFLDSFLNIQDIHSLSKFKILIGYLDQYGFFNESYGPANFGDYFFTLFQEKAWDAFKECLEYFKVTILDTKNGILFALFNLILSNADTTYWSELKKVLELAWLNDKRINFILNNFLDPSDLTLLLFTLQQLSQRNKLRIDLEDANKDEIGLWLPHILQIFYALKASGMLTESNISLIFSHRNSIISRISNGLKMLAFANYGDLTEDILSAVVTLAKNGMFKKSQNSLPTDSILGEQHLKDLAAILEDQNDAKDFFDVLVDLNKADLLTDENFIFLIEHGDCLGEIHETIMRLNQKSLFNEANFNNIKKLDEYHNQGVFDAIIQLFEKHHNEDALNQYYFLIITKMEDIKLINRIILLFKDESLDFLCNLLTKMNEIIFEVNKFSQSTIDSDTHLKNQIAFYLKNGKMPEESNEENKNTNNDSKINTSSLYSLGLFKDGTNTDKPTFLNENKLSPDIL